MGRKEGSDRQTDRQTDRQIYRNMEARTHSLTHALTHSLTEVNVVGAEVAELAAHEVVALGVAVRLAAGDFGGQEHVGAGQARVLDGPPDGLLVAVRFRRVLVAISAERK
jgi:hypothetical protein